MKRSYRLSFSVILLVCVLFGTMALSTPAHAKCVVKCTKISSNPFPCKSSCDQQTWWEGQDFTPSQKKFLTDTFYQQKIIGEFWTSKLQPALQAMTAQDIAASTAATGMIGKFGDASSFLDTQLTLQKLQAQSYSDYTPSDGLCRFGTGVKSLAQSFMMARATSEQIVQMSEDRLLGRRGAAGSNGPSSDKIGEQVDFQERYCNPNDNNGMMKELCYPNSDKPTSSPQNYDKDIDFVRTFMAPKTLDINLTDGILTDGERDIMALSRKLYANDVFDNLPVDAFSDDASATRSTRYLDFRQIAALRSVAQNSFSMIAAMKAKGSAGSGLFLQSVMTEMGMLDKDAASTLSGAGLSGTPSYYAQMDVLTKKMYQNPNFFVSLMDKPANIKRQMAAMKAIELIQSRDFYESLERQEMLLSLLLELEVRKEQGRLTP